MEGLFYNVSNGYIEGVVRGYRNTLLNHQNYSNLTQCETIDGMYDMDIVASRTTWISN